jgi:hypothetical protein
MSGDYCYVLFEILEGDRSKYQHIHPITGGTKKYHIVNWWIKNDRFPKRLQDFKAGRYIVLRLSPSKDGYVDITQEILSEIFNTCT